MYTHYGRVGAPSLQRKSIDSLIFMVRSSVAYSSRHVIVGYCTGIHGTAGECLLGLICGICLR